ncbi:MAG: NAD(P)-dependent oxidoreductase [Opitutales bacterium]
MNILVNLPAGFFTAPDLQDAWTRLEAMGPVRKTSHNTAEEIVEDLKWADHVIMWSWPALDESLLEKAGTLAYVGHLDVGQKAAQTALARQLPISCSKRGWSPAVSEMALALTLNLLRRVSDYHAAMRASDETWVQAMPEDFPFDERQLTGRAVGIIGLGGVGRRLAELLQPFAPNPLRVFDPFLPDAALAPFQAQHSELAELLSESEVVILCAAANTGTKHLIGGPEIRSLKPGTVFINVARAQLVDYAALATRLREGDIMAGIDVFEKEPLEADHPLRSIPGAYLTPHRAGGLRESIQRVVHWLIDDLEAHNKGEPRQHAVTEAMIPSLDG